MAKYNSDFFQISHSGLDCVAGETGQQGRCVTMRMSSFGALAYGAKSSVDYTRLLGTFKDKDELQNPDIPDDVQAANRIENPYVWGSTVKRSWNDELVIYELGSRTGSFVKPGFDVMDTKLSKSTPKDGDMQLNWPKEGFKYFGVRTGGPNVAT